MNRHRRHRAPVPSPLTLAAIDITLWALLALALWVLWRITTAVLA